MTSEIAVLLNPSAGRGRHKETAKAALARLSAAGPVRVLEAGTRQEVEGVCKAAVAGGARALVALGGDGTVHLALQAVAGGEVPLGIVPAGTGNDMAACFGFPSSVDFIVTALQEGRTRRADLARITDAKGLSTWYGGVLAAGFDAIVNERGNSMRWPKGPRRYDIAIMVELMRLKPRTYQAVFDGVPETFDAVLLAVGNCSSYGGGMRICPEADTSDGLLDVVWAEPVSRATLIRIKPRVYEGTHVLDPRVRQRRVKELQLDSADIVCYADGERIGRLPITVTAVPGALPLLG